MVKRIWLMNYGPFEDANFALGPLTVIVGPNASGKSIAMEALHRLSEGGHESVRALSSMKRRGADSEVEVGFQGDPGGASWRLGLDDVGLDGLALESGEMAGVAPETILIRLRPEELRKASYIPSDKPLMNEDGSGLASALAYMKLGNNEGFAAIEEWTRAIVPSFEGLRFKRAKVDNEGSQAVYGDELILDMKGAPDLHPAAVSEGTLFALGLLTMVVQHSRREGDLLFLVDELERGLHPRALAELVGHLRRLAEELNVQILATSHSPYLVDALKPEEVRLTGLLADGTATICNLTDHPDFERWKEEMSPGEFWSTVGEDWIE